MTTGQTRAGLAALRARLKRRLPTVAAFYHYLGTLPLRIRSTEQVFNWIHRTNGWRGDESVSGPGSSLGETKHLRSALATLIRRRGWRSLLDAPCGDFHWMKELNLDLDRYIGVEIVNELVASNRRRYGDERRTFMHGDIADDPLPKVDVVLCRECLVHLSNRKVIRALSNFRRSGSTYLLATTYLKVDANEDIATGEWRAVNLERAPFSLPPPEEVIDEQSPSEFESRLGKALALWRLADVPH